MSLLSNSAIEFRNAFKIPNSLSGRNRQKNLIVEEFKEFLEADQNLRLDFRLKQTVLESEAIDVFGEAQKMRELVEPSRVSLDLRTLESVPAFIEPDLFRTVQLLPGVQTLNDFSSAL